MSYENGILTISGLETDAVLIHASYSDSVLTSVEILDATTQPIDAKSGDKFFLWSSTNDMFPFCGAVTV